MKCLQRALRACDSSGFLALHDDGKLGLDTITEANRVVNVTALLAAIRSEAAGYFRTTDAIAHHDARRRPSVSKGMADARVLVTLFI